jgi:phospholipid/cholesterol/gamma-HCH transport system substrate-binding protein
MLRRSVKIQLVLFVLITLLGVGYVGAEYVGLAKGIGSSPCTVSADFADSGGIFTNAEVTYRGVTVGRVGPIHLTDSGVRVDMNLNDCSNPKIPASSSATVSDRSVIGEQYINLTPPNGAGPYFNGGEVIPAARTGIPVSTTQLLHNFDALLNSVDIPSLQTTIAELGKAFSDRGQDLGSLLDSSNKLVTAAQENLPTTIDLINASATVLQTQLDEAGPLQSFSHSLSLLSAQLKASDPDIRSLLDNGPSELQVISSFISDNKTDLGITLNNLVTVGDIIERHLDGLEEVLELYPAMAAGGPGILGTDPGVGRLGLVISCSGDPSCGMKPPDCSTPNNPSSGYAGTDIRQPNQTEPKAPNVAARCTLPPSTGINVRGSANIPGGDPIAISGGGVAYPRVQTSNTVLMGNVDGRARLLGDRSWLAILTSALN